MKKVVKFLIVLFIAIILILTIILINLNKTQNEDVDRETYRSTSSENELLDEETPQDVPLELSKTTTKENDDYVVFSISNAIQKYYNYISGNSQNNYYIQEVYVLQEYEKQVYYTYGYLLENNKIKDCYLKVKVQNELFMVETLDIEIFNQAKNLKITDIEEIDIEKNQYNNYEFLYLSSKEIAEKYITDYIFKMRFMPDKAYDLLEDNYRSKNFKDISQFKEYISKNVNRLKNFKIESCEIKVKENSIEYSFTDKSKNYYKIIVYDAMNYKIILDK